MLTPKASFTEPSISLNSCTLSSAKLSRSTKKVSRSVARSEKVAIQAGAPSSQTHSSSDIALNRVTGQDPSQIFGQLKANGRVGLVNPNGVFFRPGSRVDVSGLGDGSLTATVTVTVNGPPVAGPIRVELEDAALSGMRAESYGFASDGEVAALPFPNPDGTMGSATFAFAGLTGLYDIVLRYFDEDRKSVV